MPPDLPSSYKEWQGPNGGSWQTPNNWDGGSSPTETDNALFGHKPVSDVVPPLTDDSIRQTVDAGSSDIKLRSLWFKAGLWYTLSGTGQLTLGMGGGQDDYLLVVTKGDSGAQSEHTIEGFSHFTFSPELNGKFWGKVENYSEGGLGIFSEYIAFWEQRIQIGGSGATHFAGKLVHSKGFTDGGVYAGGGIIEVGLDGGTGEQPQPHFILQADNSDWHGEIRVKNRGFAILKANHALGGVAAEKRVSEGGSLALRSHAETPLNYGTSNANLIVTREGIRRTADTQRIGAFYNDGGENHFALPVSFLLQTFFGARGDRAGGLFLSGGVIGGGQGNSAEFVKVGPGLIALASNSNNWSKDTILRAGVLRLDSSGALPSLSNLVFEGGRFGGILELGDSDFSRKLGDVEFEGSMRWTGDGGFSAYGGARNATIDDGSGNALVLTWASTANFIGDGHALLLSSRYADNVITFTNNINLNGRLREVRVERGEAAAHAVLSGVLSGAGGGLLKTGDGLLRLRGTNTYTGATRIEAGALRGTIQSDATTGSNIVLAGGVLGLDADFTRGLGTGGDKIRWDGSGGFAAYTGGYETVNLGSSVTWGASNFVQAGYELLFGHHTAPGTVQWQTQLDLGSGNRTIRLEAGNRSYEGPDVEFAAAMSGTGTLNLLGNGRIDLTVANSDLKLSFLNLRGAELWLGADTFNDTAGEIAGAATAITISHGGTLRIGDPTKWHTDGINRINDASAITLAAGTLILSDYSDDNSLFEKVGNLTLASGANTVGLEQVSSTSAANLHVEELKRDDDSRATLNISGDLSDSLINFKLTNSASGHEVGGIIPWATANGSDWLTAETNGSLHYLSLLTSYQTSFGSGNNVKVTSSVSFSGNQTINSLNLQGNLNMGGNLTLSSGGLLSTGDNRTINGSGSITTGGILPLYVHTSDNLTFSGSARLNLGSNRDIIKALGGSLILNNNATSTTVHQARDLYIHQGTVELRKDSGLQVRRIYIGDGAGTDRLILPGGVWNPVKGHGSDLPSITLRGTPYDPRSPEYSGDQAILQLGGDGPTYGAGTKQRLAELRIEGRGTIDWRGGEVGQANILWIDTLSFSSTSDRLFIRNWYEYEDLFLVKKVHNGVTFNDLLLNQIVFEGYQDYFTTWKDYDADYWQIYPFGARPAPEPSTYGAILGAVGVALWTWRKRRAASDK